MNKFIILAALVVVAFYIFMSSLFIVNEREQAIVTRFGEITRTHSEPGIYFKIPTTIVENVQIVENRLLRYDLEDIVVQVSGGKFYNVDAFISYKIVDLKKFRESVLGDLTTAEARIDTRLESALRGVYGLRDFNAALSAQRTEMMREVRELVRFDLAAIGIKVIDVRVLRTDLTSQVSAQTFERMKAERLAEAAALRARGQEQAQTLRAIADRQAVEVVASARRDSEILRGEGDAERNAVFASAYGKDIEFFEFYRSMQSYRASLVNTDTTMLLSPESEFFQYFSGSTLPSN